MQNRFGLNLQCSNSSDFHFGRLENSIVNWSGDWTNSLPQYEPQKLPSGEDEHGCHIWGTQNAIEILLKHMLGRDYNFSERYAYIGTNSDKSGGDPFTSGQWMRKNGFIDEYILPMTQSYSEYIHPNPLPKELLELGKSSKETFSFYQEYLWNDLDCKTDLELKKELITKALKLSPIGVSVPAWFLGPDGLYQRPTFMTDNHWCVLFKETEKSYFIFDSYEQDIKEVSKDIDFSLAIRYYIVINEKSFFGVLKSLFDFIFR